MKVAFTFSGLIKDIDKTYSNFKPIIDKYQPDIFLSTWDIENPENGDTLQNFQNKYSPLLCEVESWKAWEKSYWSLISPTYTIPPYLNKKEYNKANRSSMFGLWYKIQKSNHLTKLVDKEYDIVVKLRTDIELSPNFELILNNYLNFPHGIMDIVGWDNCYGPHDFVFYGPPKLMDYTTNLFYFISKYHAEGNYIYPPENLLRHHISQKDIEIRFYSDEVKLGDGGNKGRFNLSQPEKILSSKDWKHTKTHPDVKFYKNETNIT
jgi:hypothetical protein